MMDDVKYEIWQGDEHVASVVGPRTPAFRKAMRYYRQYSNEGPTAMYEVKDDERQVCIETLGPQLVTF
jgi:hypothetical protein